MRNFVFGLLLCALASCGTNSQKEKKENVFIGDYVTEEYAQRSEGHDWTAVSIRALTDTTAEVRIRSRIDIKKPTCSFEGVGTLSADGDTLKVADDDGFLFLTLQGDTLSFDADDQSLLYYHCSGGGSLREAYVKLKEPLDESQH